MTDSFQFQRQQREDWPAWMQPPVRIGAYFQPGQEAAGPEHLAVETPEGTVICKPGDWVVNEPDGIRVRWCAPPLMLTGADDEWTDVGESPTSPGVRQLENKRAPGRVYREGDKSFDLFGKSHGTIGGHPAFESVEISFPYVVPVR